MTRSLRVARLKSVRVILIADFPTLERRSGEGTPLSIVADAMKGARHARDYSVMLMDRDGRMGDDDRPRLRRLQQLRAIAEETKALLVVNQRCDLAAAVGADGVQLPERGLSASAIRRAYPDFIIGRSCHDRAGLVAAQRVGVDWATMAPVHRPLSKRLSSNVNVSVLGVQGYADAVAGLEICTFALGGVTSENVALLPRGQNFGGVAVIGAVLLDASPARALDRVLRGVGAI